MEENFSRHKEDLLQLVTFEILSIARRDLGSLENYIGGSKKVQNIYHFWCPDRNTAIASPSNEQCQQWDRNVLLKNEEIGEHVINDNDAFTDKQFVSLVSQDKDAPETMFRHHPTRLGTLSGSLSSSHDSGMLEYLSVCSSCAVSEYCQVLRRS